MFHKSTVILVDNKRRDLMVAALIAHHLERMGIGCHLEPLEAWQGVLAAHRPDLILFNHLTASHLVKYSQRLAEMGVLTAVLPNEGILYDPKVLAFNAGKHHCGAHVDLFFCWNQAHKNAIEQAGLKCGRVEVVGVPRFDFYFSPWSGMFSQPSRPASGRPRLLFCTNFVFAKFANLPRSHRERFFGQWADIIPSYKKYDDLIAVNQAARDRMFLFLETLVASGKYDITLRPHPSEDIAPYERWLEDLNPDRRGCIRFERDTNISDLIMAHDLEISCETCTTALESWIARKPTIELVLMRHPVFYHANLAALHPSCDSPADLPALVDRELSTPSKEGAEARRQHLATWCASPNGTSARQLAEAIAARLKNKPAPDWSKLKTADYRRAFKLRFLKRFGLSYHFDPLLWLKARLRGDQYVMKQYTWSKSIMPADVARARALYGQVDEGIRKDR